MIVKGIAIISVKKFCYKGGDTTSYHPRMLLKIVVYALWDSIWSMSQTRRQYLTWDMNLAHQYTELPTVRNVHFAECVTAANATEEP